MYEIEKRNKPKTGGGFKDDPTFIEDAYGIGPTFFTTRN